MIDWYLTVEKIDLYYIRTPGTDKLKSTDITKYKNIADIATMC